MCDWLILRLEAPLLAFGGVAIDHIGVTRDFPAQSMLAGLLANALGFERTDWENIQSLQDRLVFAARRDRDDEAALLTDVQNARLEKNDKGWTTRGQPEGRDGASYGAPHRRRRDYHMDARVMVALRLKQAERQPDLDALAAALERPARPLFIGRKPCLPSAPMLLPGRIKAPNAYAALQTIAGEPSAAPKKMRALWPLGEGPDDGEKVWRVIDLPDVRNWRTGLHGGTRRIVEGIVFAPELAA
ncbi:CRISPR system Cascade subunit CasD [Rhodoblastus acidophilus]|uniref:type I-E CRISPR-associated protein Cas5/CasD n=1 Tax=Rhodoblastus acidophilus TaxID=1074 RepID=UPI002224D3EF|nr:type I-E CRISPR-associated protein Cas5/CasD [Rhodoblastus acidophilus]MCW2315695.1 CRISPR system Cascade subunit CasD [Rhodoblastus acidophilus]